MVSTGVIETARWSSTILGGRLWPQRRTRRTEEVDLRSPGPLEARTINPEWVLPVDSSPLGDADDHRHRTNRKHGPSVVGTYTDRTSSHRRGLAGDVAPDSIVLLIWARLSGSRRRMADKASGA